MSPAPSQIPAWQVTSARAAEICCDAGLIASAVFASQGAPLSVATALGTIEWAWVLLVALGGLLSAAGTLRQWLGMKLAGCCLSIGGLGAWVASLLEGGTITSGQASLCCALTSAIGLLAYRMVVTLAVISLRASGASRAL